MQGDLISRSALMKYLRDYKWEFAMGSDFSKAMEMIDAQPTAYDVEKVVAELRHSIRDYTSDYHGVEYIEPEDAIEIVRKGGVE